VVWADRRFRLGHGRAFALYVAGYTAGRFWIEQMRTDHATRVFGDIRINVVVSVVVFAAAVLYIALVRKPREVLEGPGEAPPEERAPTDSTDTEGPAEEKDGAEASSTPHSGERAP
jgi:prolipoprotein diacylglyceryltransferase